MLWQNRVWIWLCGCSVLDIRVLEASVTSVFKAEPGCKHQPLMKFQVPASWFYTIILKCIENSSLHWYVTGGSNEKGRPFIVKALKHAKPPFRQIIPYVFFYLWLLSVFSLSANSLEKPSSRCASSPVYKVKNKVSFYSKIFVPLTKARCTQHIKQN